MCVHFTAFVATIGFNCCSRGLDKVLSGLLGRQAKLNTQDHMMTDELRDWLFKFSTELALDLSTCREAETLECLVTTNAVSSVGCPNLEIINNWQECQRNQKTGQATACSLWKNLATLTCGWEEWLSRLSKEGEWDPCLPAWFPLSSSGITELPEQTLPVPA
ncbi:unnamed protein product [Pleuronectes platessa]|uniref:Uncharacterized protein n=1 Tax=Pleuronectes platessa TaxID=8262 RepID=A0A9N7UU53_PLEPL|nr:unnamed protein product [Pleuronectes platessa]